MLFRSIEFIDGFFKLSQILLILSCYLNNLRRVNIESECQTEYTKLLTSYLSMIFKTLPITPLNPGAGTEFKVFSKSSRANLTEFNQGKPPSAWGCLPGLGVGGGSSETDSGMWTFEGWPGVPAVEADRRLTFLGVERGLSPFTRSSSSSDRSITSLANGEVFLGGLEKRRRNVFLALLVDLTRLAMIEQGARVM